jgi:hypothetical protein
MIEFHGWREPCDMDAMVCAGTWASLVRFQSGRVEVVHWQVMACVSGSEFRKTVKVSPESAGNMLRHKLAEAIAKAERVIRNTNHNRVIVKRRRNGRLYAKRIEHISWMNNGEMERLMFNATTH